MQIKVKHLREVLGWSTIVIPFSYSIWGSLYFFRHTASQLQNFKGVMSTIGFAIGTVLLLCISCILIMLIVDGFKWVFKERTSNDDKVLLTLGMPKFGQITFHKKIIKALTPKGKPVIKEFDDKEFEE